jgi:hypothetical protein
MVIEGIMFDLCCSIDAGRQCTSQQQRYHSSDAGTRIAISQRVGNVRNFKAAIVLCLLKDAAGHN